MFIFAFITVLLNTMAKRVNFGVNAFEPLMKSSKISESNDIDDPEIN